MSKIRKFEKEWDKFVKERHDFYDRMDKKVEDFREMLDKADQDFKMMEAEELALKINPRLKDIVQ